MKYLKNIRYNSPVILSFVFLSLGALILGTITKGLTNRMFFSVYRSSLLNPFTYIRLFGHVLGHSDLQNFMGNMTYILLLGPIIEEKYTSKNLLEMIGITAVVTGLVNMIFFDSALLGASGIAFMFIILSSITGIKDGEIPLTLIIVVIFFLGQQVIQGITQHDNISQLTHIIGGVLGIVFGLMLNKDEEASTSPHQDGLPGL